MNWTEVIFKQLCCNRKMTWTQGIGQKDVLTPLEFAIHLNSELKISQNSQTTLPVPLEEINWTSKCNYHKDSCISRTQNFQA